MCLIIDESKHKTGKNNRFCAKMSLFPIKVYKILAISFSGKLITPYIGYQINFINKKCILSAKLNIVNSSEIKEGIHAYYKFNNAKSDVDDIRVCRIYKAMIPPFTKYFYGINGEIVAEKMIIKKCAL